MATIFIIVAIWFFMKIDWCIGRDGITFYLLSNLQYLTGGRQAALPYKMLPLQNSTIIYPSQTPKRYRR